MQEDNQDHEVGEQQQVDIKTEAQQRHFDEEQHEERKEARSPPKNNEEDLSTIMSLFEK